MKVLNIDMPNIPQIVVHTMTIVAIVGPITSHFRDSHV